MWENEVRNKAFKRGIQTIIYLPRFVSWTVMAGIVINMLAYNGAVNTVITSLGGEPVTEILTHAPGNGAPIGGLKVCAESGWFAARPSGTEAICKVYTESFRDEEHLKSIQNDALAFMSRLLA